MLLHEQLKKKAVVALRVMWAREPHEEFTPEIEQIIDEAMQTVRAEKHKRMRLTLGTNVVAAVLIKQK